LGHSLGRSARDASIRDRLILVDSSLNTPTFVMIVGGGTEREWTMVQRNAGE